MKTTELTAVEWLIDEIDMQYPDINIKRKEWMIDKAKEMEKEQSLKKIIYDLDELASEYSEGKSTSEVFKRAHESDFKAGFQKAIELLTFKQQEK